VLGLPPLAFGHVVVPGVGRKRDALGVFLAVFTVSSADGQAVGVHSPDSSSLNSILRLTTSPAYGVALSDGSSKTGSFSTGVTLRAATAAPTETQRLAAVGTVSAGGLVAAVALGASFCLAIATGVIVSMNRGPVLTARADVSASGAVTISGSAGATSVGTADSTSGESSTTSTVTAAAVPRYGGAAGIARSTAMPPA